MQLDGLATLRVVSYCSRWGLCQSKLTWDWQADFVTSPDDKTTPRFVLSFKKIRGQTMGRQVCLTIP